MSLRYWLIIHLKKVFMGKEKKNVLIVFFISYKSDVKTFLKWIVNQYSLAWPIKINQWRRNYIWLASLINKSYIGYDIGI